jgi:hypothetical protein
MESGPQRPPRFQTKHELLNSTAPRLGRYGLVHRRICTVPDGLLLYSRHRRQEGVGVHRPGHDEGEVGPPVERVVIGTDLKKLGVYFASSFIEAGMFDNM